ncbi:MAG: class I SAM-dependent methyltransferase [Syntrophorhabdaceae bacterium]|nr:class I SAM-dependent methyltransferase [Syntrophorhabdaceae bacterium]
MKEEDIRKRDTLNRYLELVRSDAERIFNDKTTFQYISCPGCDSEKSEPQFEKNGFFYVLCKNCETLYVNPRPTYEKLMEIYIDSPSTRFWVNEFFMPMTEARREKIFKPRAQDISERFLALNTGTIGDIGAGFGIFLEELKKFWPFAKTIAIEPSHEMAEICRKKGLDVIESPIEDIAPEHYQFDLLTSFELLEHLHDPHNFIKNSYSLLKDNGYFYLTTLNGLGFDIQLLWDKSKSVTPPHHLNFFNPQSVSLLLDKAGFKVIEVSTPGKLDWDIIEGGFINEGIDPGRFFKTVIRYGSEASKRELQNWISKYNFSSHMRVIAKKER